MAPPVESRGRARRRSGVLRSYVFVYGIRELLSSAINVVSLPRRSMEASFNHDVTQNGRPILRHRETGLATC
jgi:hypothetical protein